MKTIEDFERETEMKNFNMDGQITKDGDMFSVIIDKIAGWLEIYSGWFGQLLALIAILIVTSQQVSNQSAIVTLFCINLCVAFIAISAVQLYCAIVRYHSLSVSIVASITTFIGIVAIIMLWL